MLQPFKFFQQPDEMSCGATCLRMIAGHYGKSYSLPEIVSISGTTRTGVNLSGLSYAAEKLGFRTLGVKVTFDKLKEDAPLPCVAHWNQNHFVVIHKIKKDKVYVADPAHGFLTYQKGEFLKYWASDVNDQGILLLLETTPDFYENREGQAAQKSNFSFLSTYLFRFKKQIVQLFIGLIVGSLLQLIFPFLTQSIVDIGIQTKNIPFIYLILLAQLMVFFGRITIEIIRNYILMHVSSRINISLVSDFFVKLMKLPISYFDSKLTGDIMQRINDNSRIENFLTGSSLSTFFSLFNFLIFSAVLAWYSMQIFFVFLAGTLLYFFWITFFLKRRAALDYKHFLQSSQNQSKIIELINGMQEIKLHNAEREKRWQWEQMQVKFFKLKLQGLSLSTAQNSGSSIINELKNIIITFLSAKLVLDGQVTLGMMLSISYIIGQLNAPVHELVDFIQRWQDARLSLERINEIHSRPDEELVNSGKTDVVAPEADIHLNAISFKYLEVQSQLVLDNLSAVIPAKKVTAIVGSSGSGKTTLLKLLLKYYEPTVGNISLAGQVLSHIQTHAWRKHCGVVMQEGYIFSDTIANNIAVGADVIDPEKLRRAAQVANILDFVQNLPLSFNTKVGAEGTGLSTGQKQRLLIARAVYKDPDYLFFDEATSALDANNEKVIMENLNDFFKGKTVVIIAHRLSTVKNADQIIVLEKGRIIETGNHKTLTEKKGNYYELVKNQLELGD